MATKKTTTKKAATKKPAAKATAKKTPAKKPAASGRKDAAVKKQTRKDAGFLRRPDHNNPPGDIHIKRLTQDVMKVIEEIEVYAANLRALDRMRHNGVGLKRQGFIDAAFRLSTQFPQYFPHWLDTPKSQRDLDLFNAIRTLIEVCRSLEEKAWNINVEASDMVYTDALEYYSQVKDAAERRIDSAESIYTELNGFFKAHGNRRDGETAPTEKQVKRDVNALLHGRKDGEVVIKNVKPKVSGGKHEVIDETFNDRASFKETDEGSIKE